MGTCPALPVLPFRVLTFRPSTPPSTFPFGTFLLNPILVQIVDPWRNNNTKRTFSRRIVLIFWWLIVNVQWTERHPKGKIRLRLDGKGASKQSSIFSFNRGKSQQVKLNLYCSTFKVYWQRYLLTQSSSVSPWRRRSAVLLTDQYEMTIRQNPFLCSICNAPLEIIPCLPLRVFDLLPPPPPLVTSIFSLVPLEVFESQNWTISSPLDLYANCQFPKRFLCCPRDEVALHRRAHLILNAHFRHPPPSPQSCQFIPVLLNCTELCI